MDDQYEIDNIGMLRFERDPHPIRGTLYRCTLCGKRPIKVKGVLSELNGSERKRFKANYNALKNRHKRVCAPTQTPAEEPTSAGGESGGADVGSGEASESSEGVGDGADGGEVVGDGGEGLTSDSEDEEMAAPPRPPPLDPAYIQRWTREAVQDHIVHYGELPATIEDVTWIPGKCLAFVECLLRNEHGANAVLIAGTCIHHHLPGLIDRMNLAKERWKSARHQELVTLFERACAKAPESVRVALETVLNDA